MAVIPQADVISRLKDGETLLCSLPEGDNASDKATYYLSGGGTVHKKTYAKLKTTMKPVCGGLFPDCEPQEWGWPDE